MSTETDFENMDKVDRAEEWFYESEYSKGKIAGFVPVLMAKYADFYYEQNVKTALLELLGGLESFLPRGIYEMEVEDIQR